MKVVLDPNVLIAALLSAVGAPRALMERWADGLFEIIVSDKLLTELARVLRRAKFSRYATTEDVDDYVAELRMSGILLADPDPMPGLTKDPGDDYLVALARAAKADAIVSGDAHLLKLPRVDPPVFAPRAFLEALDRLDP